VVKVDDLEQRMPRNSQSCTDSQMDMPTLLNGFPLSCKVEGKSIKTVRFYKEKL